MDVKGGQRDVGIQKKWKDQNSVCVLQKIYVAAFDFELFLSLGCLSLIEAYLCFFQNFKGGGGGVFMFD